MTNTEKSIAPGLSAEQLAQFKQDGFLRLRGCVDEQQVAALRDQAELLTSGGGCAQITRQVEPGVAKDDETDGPLRKLQHVAGFDDVFAAYLKSAPVCTVLTALLGDAFVLYSDILFVKPAGVGSRQPYHQDRVLGYEINDEARMVGIWLALDPATVENGCLRFIPGSHRQRLTMEQIQEQYEDRALAGGIAEEVIVPADRGDVILIDSLVLHASEPNRSPDNRWAYSAFCVSCDAEFSGSAETQEGFMLVQGERVSGRI